MTHPNDQDRGSELDHLLGTIYHLGDCLADLAGCLLPFDGPHDSSIDYDMLIDDYVVAAATTVRTMALLVELITRSLPAGYDNTSGRGVP